MATNSTQINWNTPSKEMAQTQGRQSFSANPVMSQAPNMAQVKNKDRLNLPANKYIMENEGKNPSLYLDNGVKAVGYGFREDGIASKYVPQDVWQGRRPITDEECINVFNKIYPQAIENAIKFVGKDWPNLSINQQKSLIDMAYSGALDGMDKLKKAIESKNYASAAHEILNSKYAKKDAPNRALQNAVLMQS